MITLLSPSKTQNYDDLLGGESTIPHSIPALLDASQTLAAALRDKTEDELSQLMGISDSLACLNHERYQRFSLPFTVENARRALLAFRGDVYTDLAIAEYRAADFGFAQEHVRILSGLYGLLRPLDLIQPYRLEMKTPLATARGNTLYQFWGDRITRLLSETLAEKSHPVLVNLASLEYTRVLAMKKLPGRVVTPVFKEDRQGTLRTVAIYAKRARGRMANFIIRQRVDDPEKLKVFQEDRYEYQPTLSSKEQWVFVR